MYKKVVTVQSLYRSIGCWGLTCVCAYTLWTSTFFGCAFSPCIVRHRCSNALKPFVGPFSWCLLGGRRRSGDPFLIVLYIFGRGESCVLSGVRFSCKGYCIGCSFYTWCGYPLETWKGLECGERPSGVFEEKAVSFCWETQWSTHQCGVSKKRLPKTLPHWK